MLEYSYAVYTGRGHNVDVRRAVNMRLYCANEAATGIYINIHCVHLLPGLYKLGVLPQYAGSPLDTSSDSVHKNASSKFSVVVFE